MSSELDLPYFLLLAIYDVVKALIDEKMDPDGIWLGQYNFLKDIMKLAISDGVKLCYIYHSVQYLTLCYSPMSGYSKDLDKACSALAWRFKQYSIKSYLSFSNKTLLMEMLQHFYPSRQLRFFDVSQLMLLWQDKRSIQLSQAELIVFSQFFSKSIGSSNPTFSSLVLEDLLGSEAVKRKRLGEPDIVAQSMLVNYKLRPFPLSDYDYKLSETEFLASSPWGGLVWMLLPEEVDVLREQPVFFKLALMHAHAILTFGVVHYVELLMLSSSILLPALSDGVPDTLLDEDNTPKALWLKGQVAPCIRRRFQVSLPTSIRQCLERGQTPWQKKRASAMGPGHAGKVRRELYMGRRDNAALAIKGAVQESVFTGLKPIVSWLNVVGETRKWYVIIILKKFLTISQAGRTLLVEHQKALSVLGVPRGEVVLTSVVFPSRLDTFCDLCKIPRFNELIPRLSGESEGMAFNTLIQLLKLAGANELGLHIFEQLWRRRCECFFEVPEDVRRKVGSTMREINMALIASLLFFPREALDELLLEGIYGQQLRGWGQEAKAKGRVYYFLIVVVGDAVKYFSCLHKQASEDLRRRRRDCQTVKNDLLEKRLDRVMNRLLKLRREVSYQRGFAETCNRMPTREMDAINFSVRMFKKNFSRYSLLEQEKQLQAFESQAQALSEKMKRSAI